MKKTTLTLILLLATICVWADGSGSCGENLTWTYLTATNTLTISGTGDMADYSSDVMPWDNYRTQIKTITIQDGVTSIGIMAFRDCSALTSVTIPGSVTSIRSDAFSGCKKLTSITIPNSVTDLGYSVFYDCTALAAVSISSNVTSIEYETFYDCTALTSITIPSSVTSIGDVAFHGCTALTSITIPSSVTSIGSWAFEDCEGLASIVVANGNGVYDSRDNCNAIIETQSNTLVVGCKNTNIPGSVTSIGKGAFCGCSALTSITIPSSITSIGTKAFSSCSGLTSIVVADGNTVFDSRDNCNAIIETQSNTLIAGCKTTVIPNGVTSISNYAFYGCTELTSITISGTVTSIGNFAFYRCSGLRDLYCLAEQCPSGKNDSFDYTIYATLHVPTSSVNTYKAYSPWSQFMHIVALIDETGSCGDSLTWNFVESTNTMTISGTGAMEYYSSFDEIPWKKYRTLIKEVTVTDGVTSIGQWAFYGCTALTSITIPSSITSIGKYAFDDTEWLNNQPDGMAYIGSCAYQYIGTMPDNTNFQLKDGTVAIAGAAFMSCYGLTSIDIPNTVISIGDEAFCCTGLTSIIIPGSVTSIGKEAFADCELTSITIPNSVTYLGIGAFENTEWLNNQPNGIVYIGNFAYKYKGTMPNNTNLQLRDGIVGIVEAAFYNCSGLTSITVPSSLTTIGQAAFYGCSGLSDFYCLAEQCPSANNYTFYNTPATLHVPAASVDLYKTHNIWSQFGTIVAMTDENNNCGDNLTWTYVEATNTLTISGTGDMADYSSFEDIPWHDYSNQIKQVTIEDGVTSIGNRAFSSCGLTSITIPSSVTSIGEDAFFGCTSLTSITIPSSVTSIANGAFGFCLSLTSIVVANGNSTYDSRNNCNAIIETQSNTLIAGCKNTIIPGSVTSIGNQAFYNCYGLTSITIPGSVTSIGDMAFAGCGLTSITIPSSVTSIGNQAIWGCQQLASIVVANGNSTYDSRDNCNAIIQTQSNTLVVGCNNTIIPGSVTSIEGYAFYYCTGLTSITIPSSVMYIGFGAFYGCSNLTDLYCIAEQCPYANDFSFYYLPLQNATLHVPAGSVNLYKADDVWGLFGTFEALTDRTGSCGEDLTWTYSETTNVLTISGTGAMKDYYRSNPTPWNNYRTLIKQVIIEDGVTSIGGWAFYDCTGLNSFTIPSSVTSIEGYAFCYCTRLTSITIPGSVTSIRYGAFSHCSGLTSITISNGVLSIEEWAFEDCTGLTSITIPNSVISIEEGAFSGCSGLTSIAVANGNSAYDSRDNCNAIIQTQNNKLIAGCKNTIIPGSVASIGNQAFYHCHGLTSITIPSSVTAIGDMAFACCTGLYSFTIPSSVTSIGDQAFWGTGWYNNLPDGMVYIDNWAYQYIGTMPDNTNLQLRDGIKGIAGGAFWGYSELTSVTIPSSVISLGDWAFAQCPGLTSITIPSSVTSIGTGTFYKCTGLTSITIPGSITSIVDYAFEDCTGLTDFYCLAEQCPSANIYSFYNCPLKNATLHVPAASVDLYRAHDVWGKFGTIVALTDIGTTVDEPLSDKPEALDVYDLNGIRINQLQPGMNIIRMNDGTIRKVIVK